jgi:hypothetical protein
VYQYPVNTHGAATTSCGRTAATGLIDPDAGLELPYRDLANLKGDVAKEVLTPSRPENKTAGNERERIGTRRANLQVKRYFRR